MRPPCALSGEPAQLLGKVRGWLIDLDGVIYRGDTLVPGAGEFVASLRESGTPFRFLTNNSTRTPAQYAERLTTMGIRAKPEEFFTSALATAAYLRRQAPAGAPVLTIGMDGLCEALTRAGFTLATEPQEASYVVVGFSGTITYHDLKRASNAIRQGAIFIGTNPDPTLPVEGGFTPGNGSILAAIATASESQPLIIGKPSPLIFEMALKNLGVRAEECALLGDRLDTDIMGGNGAGLITVLILTGSTSADYASMSSIKPALSVNDMGVLRAHWESRVCDSQ